MTILSALFFFFRPAAGDGGTHRHRAKPLGIKDLAHTLPASPPKAHTYIYSPALGFFLIFQTGLLFCRNRARFRPPGC